MSDATPQLGRASRLYLEVMYTDNFTCVYCGVRGFDMTVDHFIPKSLGGPDIIQNLVACCARCNTVKGARAPYECGMFPSHGRYTRRVPEMLDPDPILMIGRQEVRLSHLAAELGRDPGAVLRAVLASMTGGEA